MLNAEKKQELIKKFAITSNDTGSSEVQVALFSERIRQINAHLEQFPKDHHSRRGLLCLVGKRKAFLNYLKRKNHVAYNKLVVSLKEAGYL
ncbi:30S ribosomal protein S15 [Candidatus Dependentiae bacterium]|nr:30S ribosomal protein S15 [Candidatus Dependentiae bacterium]